MTASKPTPGLARRLARLVPSVLHHARQGSLLPAIKRRLRPVPAKAPDLRFSAQTRADAIARLPQLAAQAAAGGEVLVIGVEGEFLQGVLAGLAQRGLRHRRLAPEAIAGLGKPQLAGVGCLLLALPDSQSQFAAARALVVNPATAEIPLEYLALPREDNAAIAEWDHYDTRDFVSPLISQHGSAFYDIYRESLSRFRRKTDIRDYLDLSQLLESVVSRGVPGQVAEFGSYKGHSGYLISRVLERLGSDKTLYMFDMFENFPEEGVGVDRFWSGTHQVDFAQIQQRFSDRANVRLVKGDFTRTVLETDTGPLALTFIDCDSYRATRVLLAELWGSRVPVGGIVIMEDYGHAALLGNRLAVHEFFDGRRDAVTWFSQFSGFYVAIKLA